ncbi:MAG TPA: Clp protease N-terminal domain-containing protein [Candidatus Udaeobacter sp.]|nr:Clp protease N-terminal domain-containing protein [Candidatus Udaeobacter sp.]
MDLGSVAVIALIAGLAGGAVGAAVVGTVEGMLRQRQVARGSVTYPGRWVASTKTYIRADAFRGDAPFNDFNDRAKRVLALAQDEAKRFNHSFIGPEHLLLGLSREGDGVAGRVLESLGATLPRLRRAVETTIGRGKTTVTTIDLAESAKTAIAKARGEAHKLGHSHIGTEHLLLGLIHQGGAAMSVARALDLQPEQILHVVIATMGQPQPETGFESLDHLDTDSRKVMTLARQEAIQNGHSYIGTEHLAVALRLHRAPVLDKIWGEIPVDLETLRRRIEVAVPPTLGATMPTRLHSTPRVGTILTMARVLAAKRKQEQISPEIFLLALADEGGGVGAQVLASLGATAQRIREIIDGPAS